MTDAERSQCVSAAMKAGYRIVASHRPRVHRVVRLRKGRPPEKLSEGFRTRSEAVSALVMLTLHAAPSPTPKEQE